MVAHLIGLKLLLLRNNLGRSVGQLVGTLIAGLYGFGVLVAVMAMQIGLGGSPERFDVHELLSAATGTLALLLWIVVPLALTGGDSLMSPRQFVTFAISRRQLITGLGLAGAISIGAVITALWLLGQVLLWRSYPGAALAALLTAPVLLAMYLLVSQATITAASAWFGGTRVRDLVAVAGLTVAILAYPIVIGVQDLLAGRTATVDLIIDVLSWTPFAAGTMLPADLARGDLASFGIRLLIVLATLAVALVIIRAGLITITERPLAEGSRTRSRRAGNIGALALYPARLWGAIAGRALTYWLRDPRYGGTLLTLPAVIVLGVVIGSQSGQDWPWYAMGPFLAWTLGFAISADISYDNTAFATQITAGVAGWADRLGRVVALLTFGLPITLAASIIPLTVTGHGEHVVLMTGLSLGLLLAASGISAVLSALIIYPTPAPGESPFKQPSGALGRTLISQFGSIFATLLVMLPEAVLLIIWTVVGADWLLWLVASVSVVKGVVLVALGVVLGGRIVDARQPELFQQILADA